MKKQTKYNNIQMFLIIIIVIYCVNGFSRERYHKFYPTINVFPNNYTEVKLVEKFVSEKSMEMDNFIMKTDRSVSYAFEEIVPETIDALQAIESEAVPVVLFFKLLFNRARPKQINKDLNVYPSISAATPAHPSGHTCQAYYLAKKLTEKYPEKREKLYELAEKCGRARIYGGLHYPSDHKFSKLLAKII